MGWRLAGAGRLRGGPARTERRRLRRVELGWYVEAGRRIVEFLKYTLRKVGVCVSRLCVADRLEVEAGAEPGRDRRATRATDLRCSREK